MIEPRSPEVESLTPEEREAILLTLFEDPILAARELLPHWFPKKIPWVHRGIFALALERSDFLLNFGPEAWMEEPEAEWTPSELRKIERHFVFEGQPLFQVTWDGDRPLKVDLVVSDKMLTIMPRGFSKTTTFKAILLLSVLYKLDDFMVYISESGTHAEAQINDIRRELGGNEKIKLFFGNLVPSRTDPQKWTDEEFETMTGVHMLCRGRGSQIRGLLRASKRPGRILFDDLEDLESVNTEEQRKKCRVWFRSDVERAGRLIGTKTKFFGLATILHHEALVPTLAKAPSWLSIRFGAIDLDGEALWPEALSLEALERTKEDMASTGDLESFYRELMSEERPDDLRKFKSDYIRVVPKERKDLVAVAIAMDPAISAKKKASKCAYAVVGIDERGRRHLCEVYGRAGMKPDEQIDKYFELAIKWDCTHHGIETVAYQQSLVHIMQTAMFQKGKIFGPKAYFEIVPIKHNTQEAKERRIVGSLQPFYASGYMTHQGVFSSYVTALLDWPNCQMDEPDAVAMANTLLGPWAGLSAGDEINDESRSPSLEEELEGLDFRTAP